MEFKIGEKQKYVVKDIFQLVERFACGATYQYGKKLNYTHTRDSLTEQSKIYLDYLIQWVMQNKDRYETVNYTYVGNQYKPVKGYEEQWP